jgi:hypothetical protein
MVGSSSDNEVEGHCCPPAATAGGYSTASRVNDRVARVRVDSSLRSRIRAEVTASRGFTTVEYKDDKNMATTVAATSNFHQRFSWRKLGETLWA